MPVSDIIYIVTTVAVAQGICDTLANRITYSSEIYNNRCAALERARAKRDKTIAQIAQNPINTNNNSNSSAKAKDKQAKKLQRAEEDFRVAATNVSQKHVVPNVLTALVFYILYKILNLEYQGKIVAILPFTPWKFFQRFTMRGIDFDPDFLVQGFEGTKRVENLQQSCGFLVVYLLATMSVKFMVKQVLGEKPPSGADKGLFTMLDDPRGQKFLTSLGVDMDELNEIRKTM
jgi:uncharacterized membrane protein (DUF106 family)